MRTLPTMMIRVLAPFAPLFSERVFEHAQVLMAGAILTPGRRTVSSALRAMGLDQSKNFHRYHRVLSRAKWSGLEASRILLDSLVEAFVPEGDPLVVGVDETLERRQGKRIAAKGIYRDPVRSSHSRLVKTSALRWVCVTLLAEVPWASRVWALPFLSALAPSERYAQERGRRHKSLTEWAWQMLLLVRRWHPEREIVAVADGGYASLKLLDRCRHLKNPITFITRLRLDAVLYEPAPPRKPKQMGRPRLKGERLANLSAVVEDPKTAWKPITVSSWYGDARRTLETHLRDGHLVLYGASRRAHPLGADPRPGGGFREPSLAVHRPLGRSGSDHFVVRETLADGVHVSRSSPALGLRDPEAVVGDGDPAHGPGTFGPVQRGHALRSPRGGANAGGHAESGLVRQEASDLLRRPGVGSKGTVEATRGDFLRVGAANRDGKSPAQVHGKADCDAVCYAA
jgi:DDE superfamily endonuclease